MKLYALPVSTYSAKVRIALGVKAIDYEMVPPPGGYSTPTYMAIVPLGTIPALRDGDFCLSESDVLIEYLEETHPEPTLLPGGPAERARQRFLSRYHDVWLEPQLRGTFAHVDPAHRDEAALAALLDRYQERVDKLEALIEPRPYMISEQIGMADCAFPATFTLADLLLPVLGREARYGPKVEAWRDTVYAHPTVKQVTDESRAATLEWMNSGGG
ncbi:MAG: glutathione S-transferase family protein [Gammaproteobacteria bacterium]